MTFIIGMATAANGVPVFTIANNAEVFSKPFGATWDQARHLWMFPAYLPASQKVLADFTVIGKRIPLAFSEAAEKHIQRLQGLEQKRDSLELPTDFTFVTKPFEHQIAGLCHAYYNMRAALFFSAGLGKSKIIVDLVRLLHTRGDKSPVIILGPLVTVRNWGKEIDRHSGNGLRWEALLGDLKHKIAGVHRVANGEADVLLTTYETARNLADLILELVPYKLVVADESQRIKDWRSRRCVAAYELAQKATRRVVMTGTPTLGSPMDLYGPFKFLADCFIPEEYQVFKNRFLVKASPNSHTVIGYKNLRILNARTQFVAMRRTKEECLDLPPRLPPIEVEYDLSKPQAAVYDLLVTELRVGVDEMIAVAAGGPLPVGFELGQRAVMLNKLLQVCSGFLIKNNEDPKFCDTVEIGGCRHIASCVEANIRPYRTGCKVIAERIPDTVTEFDLNPKLEALADTLAGILAEPSNKVIVWCQFRRELDMVEARLSSDGWKYVRVDGDTGAGIQDAVDAFNEDGSIRVYLAQISTGVGITLNAATYMVYYGLTYSLESYLQSLDRNYRIGQTKPVTVYRLLGKRTIEKSVVKLLDSKVDVDSTLTRSLSCVICPHVERCAPAGVQLFDKECVYHDRMNRPVIKAVTVR